MKKRYCSAFVALFAVLLAVMSGCGNPAGQAPDFRQVVQSAKSSVFPALIYVKVLTETYESGKKITREGAGSGVIISPDGRALTNWHVVDKARQVRCQLSDGTALHADIIGTDKDTDLALLQLKLPDDITELPYATLGDSASLREGDFVMAMGAPWGMRRSVSIGIISCTDRYLQDYSEYSLWLQSDASISPGNSGGPLVNTSGEIVGINSRGAMSGGDNAFAVPSNTVKRVVERLGEFKEVNWTYLGLQLQPLNDFERDIYFDYDSGVVVSETDPDSPARRGGILSRDLIVAINGQSITAKRFEDLPAIRLMLGLLDKDSPATLTVLRDGQQQDIEISPRAKGEVEGEDLDCPRWDITVKEINQFDNPELAFHRSEGVFVFAVKYPGNANAADLAENDIILSVDGREVKTLDDLKAIHAESLENIRQKPRLVLTVLSNGLMLQKVLDISRDYEKE